MYKGQKVVVVLPAYNAAATLKKTYTEIPMDIVDDVVLVDDGGVDNTAIIAAQLGIKHIIKHTANLGYGANQKSCYKKALELQADIIVMLHPDYQYTPMLIPAMVALIGNQIYPVVFGSRILGNGALKGGMPLHKYFFNRVLTFIQNLLMNQKLSEFHTGYRAFKSEVIKAIPFTNNSNDFIFDNEIIAQICFAGFEIAEITCPTKYFKESSSINFKRSIIYGLGVLKVSLLYFLAKRKLISWKILR
jgi:glycosyltransferase involved in cell wall biosynthesis